MPPQGNIELMSQEESAMTSRALLVKIKRDLRELDPWTVEILDAGLLEPSGLHERGERPHRYGHSYRRELGIQIDLNYRFQKRDE